MQVRSSRIKSKRNLNKTKFEQKKLVLKSQQIGYFKFLLDILARCDLDVSLKVSDNSSGGLLHSFQKAASSRRGV